MAVTGRRKTRASSKLFAKAPDPYAQHRAAIRKEFIRVTPFRLGRSIGLVGDGLRCPYTGPRDCENFGYALGLFGAVRLREGADGRPQGQAYREDYFDHALGKSETLKGK